MAVRAVSLSTTELSPHSLTALQRDLAFGVWLSIVGNPTYIHPVLYLQIPKQNASPKAISGRTSYYQARLAFHR